MERTSHVKLGSSRAVHAFTFDSVLSEKCVWNQPPGTLSSCEAFRVDFQHHRHPQRVKTLLPRSAT